MMSDHEHPTTISFAWFTMVWAGLVAINWGVICLLALAFWSRELEAGLVPPIALFALALIAVALLTMTLQTLALLLGRRLWPESPKNIKRFVLIGSTVGLWGCILCLTFLAGGVDGFIPRL